MFLKNLASCESEKIWSPLVVFSIVLVLVVVDAERSSRTMSKTDVVFFIDDVEIDAGDAETISAAMW